jgi:hypothetical protein
MDNQGAAIFMGTLLPPTSLFSMMISKQRKPTTVKASEARLMIPYLLYKKYAFYKMVNDG